MIFRISILFILLPIIGFSQLGGTSVYEFTNSAYGARENGLGKSITSTESKDITLSLKNPSLLDTSQAYCFSGTWGGFHIKSTDIGMGSFAYAQPINPRIMAMGGIQFINYGRFSGYDEDGNSTGSFFASEYQLIFGASYSFFKNFTAGIHVKPILSYLESYSSYGLLTNVGVSYLSDDKLSNASVLVSNAGTQLTSYTHKENVPYSISVGYTKELEHAPFRFTISYHDIQKFDLRYTDILTGNTTLLNTDTTSSENFLASIQANVMRHIHLSTEILIIKKCNILIGYNYRKAEEMGLGSKSKAAGFSFGLHSNLDYFTLSYGWSKQHAAGGTNYFTLSTDLETIFNKFLKPGVL